MTLDRIKEIIFETNSQFKKIFVDDATEIVKNIKKMMGDTPVADDVMRQTVFKLMLNMALPEDNPNFSKNRKFMPKKFDKSLYDNGDGNSFDSEFMKLKDAEKNTIIKKAIKRVG